MSLLGTRSTRLALALLVSCAIGATPSFGFRMIQNTSVGRVTSGNLVTCNDAGGFTHWNSSSIPWYLNTAGQGSGKQTAIQNALASWTNVANADHTLTYAGTTAAGWATDGQNTVLWASGNGCTGSCLALTALVLQSGQVIVETDVTFNSAYTWNTSGADHDTEAVAAHEFGHSLGIHHTEVTTTPRPTMYATYFGTDGRSLHSDDIAALQCAQTRYPPGGTPTGAPPVPAWMDVEPFFCRTMANLTWASSTGATFYEVQRSGASTFPSPSTIYSGPNTSFFYQGGATSTQWFRVRACNSNGCSGYRNGGSVGYYSPCL
ncbi:MAG TPA: matrixin family metalloprotease [Thermoanaerobaculia bacterium]|nr:matrixin family metalloprotease [Thermoanaerobaculia bacterium]